MYNYIMLDDSFLIRALVFILAITIHEFAHAYAADRLGDPTPRVQGRLTLNPLAHIDLFGTVILPLFLILTRAPLLFGWAKPVQFDPYNLASPRRDSAIISFAGPLSNFLMATLSALIFHFASLNHLELGLAYSFLVQFVMINVILGIFNLVPVHPLDGGKVLVGLLPPDMADDVDRFLSQYGFLILIALIFPIFGGQALIWGFIGPTIEFLINLLLPGLGFI